MHAGLTPFNLFGVIISKWAVLTSSGKIPGESLFTGETKLPFIIE